MIALISGWKLLGAGWRDERGGIGIMAAVLGTVLIGFGALAIDVSVWEGNVGTMQGAADQAALAASVALAGSVTVQSKAAAKNEAQGVAAAHGFVHGTGGVVVTTNIPPTGKYASNAKGVEVVITQPQTAFLSGVFSQSPMVASVRAVATSASGTCILMLAPTGYGIGSIGIGSIGAPTCDIDINSVGPCDIAMVGLGSVTAHDLLLGEQNQAGCAIGLAGLAVNDVLKGNAPQFNAAPALDPYASRTIPKPSTPCKHFDMPPLSILGVPSVTTFDPGTYCGDLTMLGAQSVTLSPGEYIFDGGGISSLGVNQVNGNGVTLVFTGSNAKGYGTISATGLLTMNLTAKTDGDTAGMAVWLDKAGGKAVTSDGFVNFNINGAFYAPGSDITWLGVGSSPCTQLIANRMSLIGAASFNHNCVGLGVADVGNAAGYKLVE